MKFLITFVCALLITSIVINDDGAERQRRLADSRMSHDHTQVRRAS